MAAKPQALAGRIGGFTTHARHDSREITAAARQAFNVGKFEREVDPDGNLPPKERSRRAAAARKAWMARLAMRSAQARRAKKAAP